GVTGVAGHELEQGAPSSALRRQDLDLPASLFGQEFFQDCAVLKVHRGVNLVGQILLIEVDLLQECGEKFEGAEVLEVFPEEFLPIDGRASAQVRQVHGDRFPLLMESEDLR